MSGVRTVLVVDHTASPGGGELGLQRYLAARASSPDVRYVALVGAHGWLTEALARLGVPVIVLSRTGGLLGAWRAARAVRALVRAHRPELVLSNSMRAATWVALAGVPVRRHVLYVQDFIRGGYFSLRRRILVEGVILRVCGYFLWNSEATRASAPAWAGRAAGAVVYTMSGATTVQTPARPIEGRLRILSMSRVAHWKGVHVLLDAVAEAARVAPDVQLEVTIAGGSFFGEDDYRGSLERRISADTMPVRMVGHVDDVVGLLEAHDVLAHCSLTPEPFGQVIVQGMAAGRVVVATRGGGPSEILSDGVDGLLYPAGDARELARLLVGLARDPDELRRLSRAAAAAAERFADEHVATLIAAALSDAAERVADRPRLEPVPFPAPAPGDEAGG